MLMQDNQQNQEANNAQWHFNAGTTATPSVTDVAPQSSESVQWSASEFIAYQKSAGWYLLILLGVAGLAGVVFLATQDFLSSGAIVVAGILFLIFAARKPRVLNYSVNNSGINIGDKHYTFKDFRSFSIIEETHVRSIMLTPLKRFMPAISMYFEPSDEQKITEALSAYLPYEDRKQDAVDKVMQRLRF